MADLTEKQLYNVSALGDGTDTFFGIGQLSFQRNRGSFLGIRKEGELTRSKSIRVGNDQPAVTFTINFRSYEAAVTIPDKGEIAALQVTATLDDGSTSVTITLTNAHINQSSGQGQRDGLHSFTMSGVADAIALA